MLAHLRQAVRENFPPKLLHAYRLARHTTLWPFEQEMVVARQFLSREAIAVDVGANVGLFTSLLARRSKYVIAFEPNPACVEHLSKVVPRNCEVIAKAASDREGMSTLRVPLAGSVPMDALASIETANRFETETRSTGFVTHRVETMTLDKVLLAGSRSDERVAFINIDAEGHEFAVLRGAEGVIKSQRPVFLIELEYRHGAAVADVFAWLKGLGYSPLALVDGRSLASINPAVLREMQSRDRLVRRLAGDRRSGYVNNIFFIPEATGAPRFG
jgi:FkbM family methyltransferase